MARIERLATVCHHYLCPHAAVSRVVCDDFSIVGDYCDPHARTALTQRQAYEDRRAMEQRNGARA